MKNINIIYKLIENGITISAMESCTGGLLASTITDVSGASDIFKGSFVTYCNEAKIMQGVDACCIEKYGVYSKETASAMAKAAMKQYNSMIGIGITGSLGRVDPNNADSQVGHVYVSICINEAANASCLKDSASASCLRDSSNASCLRDSTNASCMTLHIVIPDDISSRHEMKEYVIDEVLGNLMMII